MLTEISPFSSGGLTNTCVNRLRTSLSLQQPTGAWTNRFVYDAARRLTNVTSQAGSFGYVYRAGRLVKAIGFPGGCYITNTYDPSGMLLDTYLKSGSTVLNHHGYTYNQGFYRTNATRTDASHISYSYDNIGQLVKATAYDTTGTGTPRLNEAFGYGYDTADNLISRTNGVLTETFTPDNLNQLGSISRSGSMTVAGLLNLSPQANSLLVNGVGAAVYNDLTFATTNGVTLANGNNTFTASLRNSGGQALTNAPTLNLPASVSLYYDYDGNLTNDGLRYFEYDDADRVTAVTVSNAWRCEYTYDGLWRRRMTKQYGWNGSSWGSPSNEIHYVYEGMLPIQERNSANTPMVSYTRGIDLSGALQSAGGIAGLLARTDTNGAAFYHADGNGNITALINSAGTRKAAYLYDPFGNTVAMSGLLAGPNTQRFSSKEVDTLTGQYSFTYRIYEPNLQRWDNRDPLGLAGGINLHRFVGNSPPNYVDPLGFGYGNPVSGADGPVGPSSSYIPGFPFFPNGYNYQPRPTPQFPFPTSPRPYPEYEWNQYTGEWYEAAGIQTDDDVFALLTAFLGEPFKMGSCAAKTAPRAFWAGADGEAAAQASGAQLLKPSQAALDAAKAGDWSVMRAESAAWAKGASGDVPVFFGNGKGRIFLNDELPELLKNMDAGKVKSIQIDF